MVIITDERCTGYAAPGHPEGPARVSGTLDRLRRQNEIPLTWTAPCSAREEQVLRAHSSAHLHHLLSTTDDFDPDTPWVHDIAEHAWRSAGGALRAMSLARDGQAAFSIMRPPGHHATRGRAMGFCYLNNVAIAALEAISDCGERLAVFDFDVHHGNGTEAILLNNSHAATFSVHQYPCYPGTGTEHIGNNAFNYPVAPMTPRVDYRKVLAQALEDVKAFRPDLVAVSAGFDAYVDDPIAQETLEAEDFHWIGAQVRSLGVPAFHVLEGGYSTALPELVLAYLRGVEGK
ncbi:MAG: histone deacetylase [Verrucomicrobia bacterium]|nr:histone deacetylase [Verrucomicrobiota bacterium]